MIDVYILLRVADFKDRTPRPAGADRETILTCRILLTLLISVLTAGCGTDEPAPRRSPKVLVIGIDGVRPDVVAEVPTPNLDALAAEGAFTAHARTGLPSD